MRDLVLVGLALVAIGAGAVLAAPAIGVRLQRGPPGLQRPLAGHDDAGAVADPGAIYDPRRSAGVPKGSLRSPTPLRGSGSPAAPRIVLIDGLGAADADASPAWQALCAAGRAFDVDVGFPTRSLPVQAALWTGLTPTQLGLYANLDGDARLAADAPARQLALPGRLAGSVAVVENHAELAGSFGFATLLADGPAWRQGGFAAAARAAAAAPAPLVLIHALAVDEAGHRGGRATAAYRDAVADADALLAGVVAAAPPTAARPLLALADHGHLAGGGHGDAEASLRRVRACIAPDPLPGFSSGSPDDPAPAPIHLVDLARHLAAITGQPLAFAAVGRPLTVAVRHPDSDATLPHPGAGRFALAALALAVALATSLIAARRLAGPRTRPRCIKILIASSGLLWWLLALGAYLAIAGAPTLSHRPRIALGAAAIGPGLALLAWRLTRRDATARPVTAAIAQLALPAGAALAVAIVAGVPQHLLVGIASPLQPFWTARAIAVLGIAAAGAFTAGLALLLRSIYDPRRSAGVAPKRLAALADPTPRLGVDL